jgi:hypothetical protein
MMSELDAVVLTRDLPEDGLRRPTLGPWFWFMTKASAMKWNSPVSLGTHSLVMVPADTIRAVSDGEIAHVRQVA